ncbi:MAG: beta-glucuronidase [Ruminococcaceae bacterium]|nr:beta-glucuronidase [Oscillospiraceae bacterium]
MNRLFDEHEKRAVRSLDGTWKFCADPQDEGEARGYAQGLPEGTHVTVPGVWNTELGLLDYEGVAWYEKRFFTEGGTLRFRFGAVMTEAKVYLDGEALGDHYGGFCQFDFVVRDVTPGYHVLTVRVDNRFDARSIPQKKVDWYHYGGITRSVSIERLQGICALYQQFDYTLSADLTAAVCHSTIELYNAAGRKSKTRLRLFVDGAEVFAADVFLQAGESKTLITPDFSLSDIRLWDVLAPQLYDLRVVTDTDDLIDRVGFRLVEAKEGKILLNGREIELRGINRHEDHPDWGMAFPQGLMKRDLDIVLNMGCNTVRGSHYPNSRAFLDMLDETGVLFWSEIPIWGCGFAPETLADPAVIERGLAMHREMARYYYNHPSIVIWGTHNEIRSDLPESVEMSKQYYEYLKANGGNRLVTFASNMVMDSICYAYCDVISLNVYIGWYGSKPLEAWGGFLDSFRHKRAELGMEHKAVVMSEFGGAAIYGHHTFDDLKGTEEYQAKLLAYCLELFHADPMIAGTYIWQFCDIRTAPQMGLDRARSYNNKGIVNEYRRPKMSYHAVKALYHRFAKEGK